MERELTVREEERIGKRGVVGDREWRGEERRGAEEERREEGRRGEERGGEC